MRTVIWTDDDGYKHKSLVRDDVPDELAHEEMLQDPPDVKRLDIEEALRVLHNQLVDRELYTYDDLVRQQNGVTGAILAAFKNPVINLFKERRV